MSEIPIILDRPLVSLDIEATGTNPTEDRIVELGVVKLGVDGQRTKWVQRFNPEMPIPAQATEVHGITDADVADAPLFRDHARLVLAGLRGCDLLGYNLRTFDMVMLGAEFERAGLAWAWREHRVIDAGTIFKRREPRTLEAAVERFCGRKHEGAHGALPDAEATIDVLAGQIRAYDLERTVEALEKEGRHDGDDRRADLAGKLRYDDGGYLCFDFGQHRGKRIADHLSYAEWMLKRDFSLETKALIEREFNRIQRALDEADATAAVVQP